MNRRMEKGENGAHTSALFYQLYLYNDLHLRIDSRANQHLISLTAKSDANQPTQNKDSGRPVGPSANSSSMQLKHRKCGTLPTVSDQYRPPAKVSQIYPEHLLDDG